MKQTVLTNIEETLELLQDQKQTIEIRSAIVHLERFKKAISVIAEISPQKTSFDTTEIEGVEEKRNAKSNNLDGAPSGGEKKQ